MLLTQRLVLEPRLEYDLALADDRDLDRGAGSGTLEAGLRLHWRVTPAFSPYLGYEWERTHGRSGTGSAQPASRTRRAPGCWGCASGCKGPGVSPRFCGRPGLYTIARFSPRQVASHAASRRTLAAGQVQ